MLRIPLLLFLFINSLFACKTEWKFGENSEVCIIVSAEKREFQYFMPNHAKGVHLPLVIVVSKNYKSLKQLKSISDFSRLSEKSASFIAVYPRLNVNNKNEDALFISRLIKIVPRTDKSEVYLVGIDYSPSLMQDLVCKIEGQLKGIAVVNKNIDEENFLECQKKKPLNIFYVLENTKNIYLRDKYQKKRNLSEKIIWYFRLIKVN